MTCSIVKPKQQLHLLCYLHKPDYTNFPVYIPILGSLSKKKNCSPWPVTHAAFTNIHRSDLPHGPYMHMTCRQYVHSKWEYLTQLHILQILMLHALTTSSL